MQPLLGDTGPSGGHRQHLAVSQPYAIGNTALERFWATRRPPACLLWRLFEGSWASLKLLVALLWSNPGPSAACRSAGAGPIPCHRHCLFQGKLGQSHAIGIVSLESSFATRSALNVLSFTADGLELAHCCFNSLLAWPSLFYGIS